MTEQYGTAKKALDFGNYMMGVKFTQIGPKVRKKFAPKEVRDISAISYNYGTTELLQIILTIVTEINELKDDELVGQNKFDLLQGELEQLGVEATNYFRQKWGKNETRQKIDIFDLKDMMTDWKLTWAEN